MREITNSGWVEVITGCMFSGKTEEMLRRLRRAEIAGEETTAFIPEIDTRYGEDVLGSHAGRTWKAIPIDPAHPAEITQHVEGDEIIAIDEGNFFEDDLCLVCQELASNGHRVIVSGTDQTFRGEPFLPLPQLMAVAEYVDKMTAICSQCGEPATRNQRLIDGEPAPDDAPTIHVGGEESYEARCRACHTVSLDSDRNEQRES